MAFNVVNCYSLQNYTFELQEQDPDEQQKDDRLFYHLRSLRRSYSSEGMRITVQGILMVHIDNEPNILLLRRGNFFKLPGGRLRPGENEKDCLDRKLSNYFGASVLPQWRIGECVATWWRPKFDKYIFPYDGYIETAKEQRKFFLVHLIETGAFEVLPYYDLYAVTLEKINYEVQTFGPLSFLPQQLYERCHFNMIPE